LAVVLIGVVALAVPTAGQSEAYDAALESGDLTTLIPEAFADAEMMSGMTFEAILGPAQLDSPDGAAAREELMSILAAAAVRPEDAQAITGFTGDAQAFVTFSATRLPGVAAGDWFEPFYRVTMLRRYADPFRELVPVGSKQVLRIADRGSDRSDLLYAQGEILWELVGDDDLGAVFLEGLETIEGPALLVDPGALVDGEPVPVIGTVDDPLSQIPAEINGATISTQTFPVATVLEGVDPANPEAVSQADRLRALLEGVGGPDRATIISSQGRADDGGIIIIGLHVDGAEWGAFRDGFVDLFLLSEVDEPQFEETQLGGKPVTRISEAGRPAAAVAYVYGVGETAWILRGQDEYITALLRTMP
jgi:hypothetical protein